MRNAALADSRCTAHLEAQVFTCPQDASLLLKSADELTLVEDNGLITVLKQFNYADESMPEDNVAISYVGNGRRYTVQTESRGRYEIVLDEAQGKSIEFAFAVNATPTKMTQAAQNLSVVASLTTLRAATTSGYFYDATAKRLYVRVIGGAGAQALVVEAPFVAGTNARGATTLPASAPSGLGYAVTPSSASYAFRYTPPTGTPSRQGVINAATVTPSTVAPAIQNSGAGDTAVLQGFVYAPVDGEYRFGLWGNGGGTGLWMGGDFLMGEPWALINSNWLQNGALKSEFEVFHPNGVISLRAGWHPVTLIHAKVPENREANELYLRWIPPGGGSTWVYPQVRRAP
jgi:hypothetical protein